MYGLMVQLLSASAAPFLLVPMIATTVIIILVLWFVVGGVRKAELMISVIIAPLVWPAYLIHSLEDIPKTAFRSFLGLNATLLIVVGMLRLAMRLAFGAGLIVNVWQLVPALSVLIMTVFLPMIIKRIVGQGHAGTTALVAAAQLVAGLKFLAAGGLGAAAGGAAAAPPAAGTTGGVPAAPTGASAYPQVSAPASGGALGAPSTVYRQARIQSALGAGEARRGPAMLDSPLAADNTVIDIAESDPGTGRFDVVRAVEAFEQGRRQIYDHQVHQQHARSLWESQYDDKEEL
jgi:hypothetical protein